MPPISELGPDALLEPMNAEEFVASLSKKKIAIKALLLDQVQAILSFHVLNKADLFIVCACRTRVSEKS